MALNYNHIAKIALSTGGFNYRDIGRSDMTRLPDVSHYSLDEGSRFYRDGP